MAIPLPLCATELPHLRRTRADTRKFHWQFLVALFWDCCRVSGPVLASGILFRRDLLMDFSDTDTSRPLFVCKLCVYGWFVGRKYFLMDVSSKLIDNLVNRHTSESIKVYDVMSWQRLKRQRTFGDSIHDDAEPICCHLSFISRKRALRHYYFSLELIKTKIRMFLNFEFKVLR